LLGRGTKARRNLEIIQTKRRLVKNRSVFRAFGGRGEVRNENKRLCTYYGGNIWYVVRGVTWGLRGKSGKKKKLSPMSEVNGTKGVGGTETNKQTGAMILLTKKKKPEKKNRSPERWGWKHQGKSDGHSNRGEPEKNRGNKGKHKLRAGTSVHHFV